VEYILIGGVAVIIHGMGRLTRDIDIFVKINSHNIQQLQRALYSIYEDASIHEITMDELNEYSVIRYGTPTGFFIDIMTRLGEVAGFDDLEYEMINFQGVSIRVATPDTLYKLKKNTVRFKDKMDAAFLEELIKTRKIEHSD